MNLLFSNFGFFKILRMLLSLSVGSYTGICLIVSCSDEDNKEQNRVRALMCLLPRFCVSFNPCVRPLSRKAYIFPLFLPMGWKFAHLFALTMSFSIVSAHAHTHAHGRWRGNALLRSFSHKEHGVD